MLMFKERHIQPCSSHSRMAPASCSSAVEEDGGQAAAQVGLSLNISAKRAAGNMTSGSTGLKIERQ